MAYRTVPTIVYPGGLVRIPTSGGGGGNATVPAGALIEPPQAFVNTFNTRSTFGNNYPIFQVASNGNDNPFFGQGITSMALDLYVLESNSAYYDLSGNNFDLTTVNGIVFFAQNGLSSNCTLDISGGVSARPTTPTVSISRPDYLVGDSSINYYLNIDQYFGLVFDINTLLAASQYNPSSQATMLIGVQDSPTAAAMVVIINTLIQNADAPPPLVASVDADGTTLIITQDGSVSLGIFTLLNRFNFTSVLTN